MRSLQKRTAQFTGSKELRKVGLYPFFKEIESAQDTEVIYQGRKVLMFGSNSYLGLTNHPRVKEAAIKALKKYGAGSSGSRLLNGSLDIHRELETALAEYVGKEAALVHSTGFQVNVGVIPAITGRQDYILLDKLDHASIIEGARLSFAKKLKFDHNNMASLEKNLKNCEADKLKLIIIDGIFSMDGDITKLPEIVKLANKYDATIMLDDAHSLGVIGKNGSGTASHFGLTDEVDLIMGTFSKSLATVGGFVAADKDTIEFLRHYSRAMVFSASLTPASTASVLEALKIIKEEPERIVKLWDNTNYAIEGFRSLGFDIGNAESPIIPIYIRDDPKTYIITSELLKQGIFVNPVVAPATTPDSTLIRFSLMATHTREQIDRALEQFRKIGKQLELI